MLTPARCHQMRVLAELAAKHPENPDFLPIVLDLGKQTLDIEGLVVGVVRTM